MERVQADFAPLVQTIISETVTGFKLDFMLPDWAALMYSISFEATGFWLDIGC